MSASPRDFISIPREKWSDEWLQANDPEYVKLKAGRRTCAAAPQIDRIVEPITLQTASGDQDLRDLHLGGKLTADALRQRRVAPGVRRVEPAASAWGTRRGNGRDGVLRRSIDREWQAVREGQVEFHGDGFTSPPAPREWPRPFAYFWPPTRPLGQLCFTGHGFTLGVQV